MNRSGDKAESLAVKYLTDNNYEIVNRNWKNKFAEIDIIAKKDEIIHFIEVKYRKSARHGSAYEYLTEKKLRQVRFAAKIWINENNWRGQVQIDGISITGRLNINNLTFYTNI